MTIPNLQKSLPAVYLLILLQDLAAAILIWKNGTTLASFPPPETPGSNWLASMLSGFRYVDVTGGIVLLMFIFIAFALIFFFFAQARAFSHFLVAHGLFLTWRAAGNLGYALYSPLRDDPFLWDVASSLQIKGFVLVVIIAYWWALRREIERPGRI